VDAVQAASEDAMVYRAGSEAEGDQLVDGHDAMLARRKRGDRPVGWAEFPSHTR
jgi:hypothetical protein